MDINLILIKALQLVCCLSLLVVLHEGGHFFFAKISGVKVEKFYMFFNPYFHLFSTRDKWFTRLFPYFKGSRKHNVAHGFWRRVVIKTCSTWNKPYLPK